MEITVQKLNIVIDGKQGYAFIDKNGNCVLITYGESMLKSWTQMLKK